ncbi:MAG: hypothetical protein ACR2MS_00925, partial [Weeksellaceae bacterium]
MKNRLILLITLFSSITTLAQIGINTDAPEATLDVNGNVRVRQTVLSQNGEYVLSADKEGYVRRILISELSLGAVNMESAMFIPGQASWDGRVPTLDLWTGQEDNGLESIKRYYFLGQNVSVTLPKNISKIGDETARVITFIVVRNEEFTGSMISGWNVAFQTKLYQESTDSFEQGNGGVNIYENTFVGSRLTSSNT